MRTLERVSKLGATVEMLIDEIRHLGNETLASWSEKVEIQAALNERGKHKKFQQREKKIPIMVHLRTNHRDRTSMAQR
ncbi:MAG: hypothetical protein HOH33_14545 [Verrucomicrobia bacterium]|jgi:hypothetical protein|nr:hypothetical protein [Verrucomicrobiota bacterium]